ncbi:hybrid sensor histidine kinase/response regulator [Roseateles terrae]|uniref:histidine kinase n=1 Tax=Roseateles terrae TaxID=431060 RepID=A0ABR6GT20_9BURK|nr:Hpt domain-containing protein [Roseateles terrae]MBB3195248.1 chemosensory pili system protein ChpA (sensor histidine kinase/response regulator) [Roseateles terrae]OWQ87258.1 hypothetical protein CDN98_10485 [Roseateles terrae]
MDLSRESEFPADLSPLAWVQEELRRTLESVHKALRRVLRDTDARVSTLGGEGQPSPALQGAAQQMHQAAGVLAVVSLPAAAHLLRAAEATLFRLAENPALVSVAEVEAVERADFAVLAFIAKTLAGGQPSSLALFPAYQTLQELNGAGRIHPADLWTQEFRWRDLPTDAAVRALTPEQMRAPFEALLLKQMRAPAPGQGQLLSDLCAGLALTQTQPHGRTLWMLAAAQFEAQSRGLLPVDTLVKRLGSRLLAQLRAGRDAAPSERLAKDLLFFAAAAKHPAPGSAPRLEAVQLAYGLIEAPAVDYRDDTLGKIDPTWVQAAKRRVATAKESWGSAAEGETHRLGGLDEQFAGVAESLQKLFPSGEVLGDTLRRAVVATLRSGRPPEPTLAMEIATAMLYLEAALEDEAFDQPEQADRVVTLSRRIEAVAKGQTPEPLEAWMEELYRRVADRQTLGSVVHELRNSLSEVERQCDEYFRDPTKRDQLIPVPSQLQTMRGVFSVLGLSQAAQATLRMRDQVDELAQTEVDPSLPGPRAQFDRLANNLGALGFLIDMLSVQPQLAKRMFRFDDASGLLQSLVGRESEHHPAAEVADAQPEEAPAPQLLDQLQATAAAVAQGDRPAEDLARDLERISQEARAADDLHLAQAAQQAQQQLLSEGQENTAAAESLQQFIEASAPVAPPAVPESAPIPQEEADVDQEMLEIFLEEVGEVVTTARDALAVLARDSSNREELTTVRRAFHTLKGSSRMVGLNEFGEAGWAFEQLFNHRLSEHPQADADLLRASQEALDAFQAWATAIGEKRPHGYSSAPFRAAADALRLNNRYEPLKVSAAPVVVAAAPAAAAASAPAVAPMDVPELVEVPEIIEVAEVPEVVEVAELPTAVETLDDLPLAPLEATSPVAADGLPALDLPGLDVPPLSLDTPVAPAGLDEPTLDLSLDFPTEATQQAVPSRDMPPLDVPQLDAALDLSSLSADASLHLDPAIPELVEVPDLPEMPVPAAEAAPLLDMPEGWPTDLAPEQVTATEPMPLPIELPDELHAEAADAIEATEPSEHLDLDLLDLSSLDQPTVTETTADTPVTANVQTPAETVDLHLDLHSELLSSPSVEAPVQTEEPIIEQAFAPVPAVAPVLSLVGGTSVETDETEDLTSQEDSDEGVKVIGHLRISIALFNIFLNEADERSRRLQVELTEWSLLPQSPLPQDAEPLAHALAGSAATVGFDDLSTLARALEHALGRAQGHVVADPTLFQRGSDEIRRLLHQFAAGFLKEVDAVLLAELQLFQPGEPLPDGALDSDEGLLAMTLDEVSTASQAAEPQVPPAYLAAVAEPVPSVAHDEFADDDFDFSLPDQIEPELMPIFEEEAEDLLRQLHAGLREWASQPQDASRASACMRVLHTFKGGARLAGAMRLGEQAHNLESQIERLMGDGQADHGQVLELQDAADALEYSFQNLQRDWRNPAPVVPAPMVAPVAAPIPAPVPAPAPVEAPAPETAEVVEVAEVAENAEATEVVEPVELMDVVEADEVPAAELPVEGSDAVAAEPAAVVEAAAEPVAAPAVAEAPVAPVPAVISQPVVPADIDIDWAHFSEVADLGQPMESAPVAPAAQVRVRGVLLERMAALSGEVAIRRARLESELGQMRVLLGDLDDNLERLRTQLRELELQAEARIAARQEAAQATGKDFDPLEFDRYTRFQELTRMLAESVNDVATVQRGLQRNVAAGEDELAGQSRLTRELQDDLLRTRMVEFDNSLGERLHRVVRQAARESGKQAQLEVRGGGVELDRSVLERLTGAFEHLLRNSVVHGIEAPAVREAAGKAPLGRIVLSLHQEGNEIQVRFSDDGAGLNLERIRARGESQGLIQAGQSLTNKQLMELIYEPGFSTAESLTEMAGRGVGMDVVRSEVNTLGGYVLTDSTPGQGASFELRVPLTTALTQVVVLRYGERKVAVPASLMLSVQRLTADQVDKAYQDGFMQVAGEQLPFYWLGGLMNATERGVAQGRTLPVVLVHSAQQRLALHVDEVLGNQEVVVKNLGPQLMQVPGLAGISLLASGDVALIYNPVALANRYGHAAQQRVHERSAAAQVVVEKPIVPLAPLVMVVDDSLTVRRVTQRMLEREGYRVLLAKDGLDAMERLSGDELPAVVLSDIEMPRMDGFDLVRNLRADARLRALPVIMITSRIAQKHRDYAQQLGVDDYLGKPYDEEHLLGLIGRYTAQNVAAQAVVS